MICKRPQCSKNFTPTNRLQFYCKRQCGVTDAVTKRRKKLKELAVAYKGGKCVNCGYNRSIAALQFHHLDPTKKDFGIAASGLTRGWEKVKIELDKCELICANCHAEEHTLVPVVV